VIYLDKSKSKIYDKLIRDRIPEIIEAKGSKPVTEVLDNERYKEYLDNKLIEELREYQESDNVEELADLVEVVYALLDYKGIAREQFEKVRIAKAEERGMFKKRLLLKEVIEV
jgi:predicted house-cleaning noncanonical NTP pyrophosphatase (MazG superfamily)